MRQLLGASGVFWELLESIWAVREWFWAVPERSGDVPRSCRAGIIDFSMVFGGLGGGEATGSRNGAQTEGTASKKGRGVLREICAFSKSWARLGDVLFGFLRVVRCCLAV